MLIAAVAALPAAATPPSPLITMRVEWLAPQTLAIVIDSQLPPREAELIVTAGDAGERLIVQRAISVLTGRTDALVSVVVTHDFERVNARVSAGGDELLLVANVHVVRAPNGETRQASDEEIAVREESRRAASRDAARRHERERMREHVRRVLARGGKPSCSAEAAPEWNSAVLEVMSDSAPPQCRALAPK